MEIVFLPKALDDLKYWKRSGQKNLQERILALIESIQKTPFDGIGKPEPLKNAYSGKWSRRINNEHRIIYEVKNNEIYVHSLKDHY